MGNCLMKREPAVLRELGEPAAPRETEAHMQQAGHPRGGKKSKTKKSKPEECPICMELTVGVETLPHGNAQGDVSSHRACETCQAAMLERNQKCPWCRDDVVWKQVFGFLDGLKNTIGMVQKPDDLANLMGSWQECEMTRSKEDVHMFARDMIQDVAIGKLLDRAIKRRPSWIRDSAGLWFRFHAMVVDGEVLLLGENAASDAARLAAAVLGCLRDFRSNGGSAAEHGGAMYAQVCVAILCAQLSGSSVATLAPLCKQVGEATAHFWAKDEGDQKNKVVRHLPKDYVEATSVVVYGGSSADCVLTSFFK